MWRCISIEDKVLQNNISYAMLTTFLPNSTGHCVFPQMAPKGDLKRSLADSRDTRLSRLIECTLEGDQVGERDPLTVDPLAKFCKQKLDEIK